MKAVLIAAGRARRGGTRIAGKSLLQHTADWLKRSGVTEVGVLGEIPAEAGDLAIALTPLDGKGALKEFITGTAVFLDSNGLYGLALKEGLRFHRQKKAAATLLTQPREKDPYSCGVFTDKGGTVLSLSGSSEEAGAGVLLLEKSAAELLPDKIGTVDALAAYILKVRERLSGGFFAVRPGGEFRSAQTAAGVLRCLRAALDGVIPIDFPAPEIREGVRSMIPLHPDMKIVPPCYLGEKTAAAKDAVLGPYVDLEEGAQVGSGAQIANSLICGDIGPLAQIDGALVGKGATVGRGALLSENSEVEALAQVGADAVLLEGARLEREEKAEAGARIRRTGALASWDKSAPTAHLCDFGGALATLGSLIALSCDGSDRAQSLMGAIQSGVRLAGSNTILCDSRYSAAAAFMAPLVKADFSVFIREDMGMELFGSKGLPVSLAVQRRIEAALRRGVPEKEAVGRAGSLTGACEIYEASKVRRLDSGIVCSVSPSDLSGGAATAGALRRVLQRSGASVLEQYRRGAPQFELSASGLKLFSRDEEGAFLDARKLMVLAVICAIRRGETRPIVVWEDIPHAVDGEIAGWGGTVVSARAGAQQEGLNLDGFGVLMEILSFLDKEELTLREAATMAPDFFVTETEVELKDPRSREQLLEALAQTAGAKNRDGVGFVTEEGWASVHPASFRSAVRLVAEARSMEASEELCRRFGDTVRRLARQTEPLN